MLLLVVSAGILSLVAAYGLAISAVLCQRDKYSKLVARRLPEGHRGSQIAIDIVMSGVYYIFQFVSILLVYVSVGLVLA
jgi:hypothetical protein